MDRTTHTKVCIYSLPIAMTSLTVAFVLCGVLPPQSPTHSSGWVSSWYASHETRIQLGAIVGTVGAIFYAPFAGALAWETKRISGNSEAAYLQVILGVIATWGFVSPWTTFMAASFRPDRPAEVTHALYDEAWLPLYTVSVAFGLQFAFLAWAMLKERTSLRSYPAWFAYFTVFTGVVQVFGVVVVLTKTGPFAWNGAIAYWFPLVVFGVWTNFMMKYMTARLKSPTPAGPTQPFDDDAAVALDGAV